MISKKCGCLRQKSSDDMLVSILRLFIDSDVIWTGFFSGANSRMRKRSCVDVRVYSS